jgi:hypothetical protein
MGRAVVQGSHGDPAAPALPHSMHRTFFVIDSAER